MLGIHIAGEPLDITPGTQLEIEQQNPFLQFAGDYTGDYTLPFQVQATPKNLRLLEFAGLLQKRVDNRGIDCQVFDNGLQHSTGKIKIESPVINRNRTSDGTISCYYLSGVASFFQDIKDRKMTDVNLGGDRTWPQTPTNFNPDAAGTFWHHIHQVLDAPVGAYDYAFFPVLNQEWKGDLTATTEINRLKFEGGRVQFNKRTTDDKDGNVIIPFPYLHFVLKKAVAHVGWSIEGDLLNDPDFKKIVMVNFFAVEWCLYYPGLGFWGDPIAYPNITINLQNHMPPEMTIAEFLLALKNRFGWWFDFDRKNKIIRVKQLNAVVGGTTKDVTPQASTVITKKIEKDRKVYALKNEFVGAGATGAPNLSVVQYKGEANKLANLPAATAAVAGHVYLVRDQNNFFVCRQSGSGDTWAWQLYAANIYDVEPEGANEDITTKATTIGMEYSDRYGQWCPRYDLNGVWVERNMGDAVWSVHLLMYHGGQMSALGRNYPFATSGVHNWQGNQVSAWSVAFQCKTFDGVDVGLYAKNWQKVLASLADKEQLQFSLNLTPMEMMQLQFSDAILVDGVKMYLSKIQSTVPFSGVVQCEAYRLN